MGLRLGTPLVRAHQCVCRSEVEPNGHHGLACRRSAGRHRRHALANEVIVRAVRSAEVHAELEPSRLLRGDGKRPDGATLDPWHSGRYLVWDFTCPLKYAELTSSGDFIFAPIAIETLGTWGPSALALCAEIGDRVANLTGDIRAPSFLKQRLALAVQRGNAAVVGTHPMGDISDQ